MTHMLFAPQSVLRTRLKVFGREEQSYDDMIMGKAWVDGISTLDFLLSEQNEKLLRYLRLSHPEDIPELTHCLLTEQVELMQRLQLFANTSS